MPEMKGVTENPFWYIWEQIYLQLRVSHGKSFQVTAEHHQAVCPWGYLKHNLGRRSSCHWMLSNRIKYDKKKLQSLPSTTQCNIQEAQLSGQREMETGGTARSARALSITHAFTLKWKSLPGKKSLAHPARNKQPGTELSLQVGWWELQPHLQDLDASLGDGQRWSLTSFYVKHWNWAKGTKGLAGGESVTGLERKISIDPTKY